MGSIVQYPLLETPIAKGLKSSQKFKPREFAVSDLNSAVNSLAIIVSKRLKLLDAVLRDRSSNPSHF